MTVYDIILTDVDYVWPYYYVTAVNYNLSYNQTFTSDVTQVQMIKLGSAIYSFYYLNRNFILRWLLIYPFKMKKMK